VIVALAAAPAGAAAALPSVPADVEPLLPGSPFPTRGPLPAPAALPLSAEDPVRDAIVEQGSQSADVELAAAQTFLTPDGYRILVRWSDTGPYGPDDAQGIADFLSSLLHDNELRALSVFLATPAELGEVCQSSSAIACYSVLDEEMIISGDPSPVAGLSREFVIAHEYGHHLAANRNNAPFPAFVFGTKYWATQQRICPGVVSGRYQPAGNYYRRPGEAFAESYAFLHYPNETPWEWTPFPHPNAASYAAIARDTLKPWHRRVRGRVIRSVGGGDRVDAFLVRTPLDGRLTLKLRAHSSADLDLYVIARKKLTLLARRAGGGRRKKVNMLICGRSGVRVLVVADRGGSRYTLKAARP
jgi:hypothetical protein